MAKETNSRSHGMTRSVSRYSDEPISRRAFNRSLAASLVTLTSGTVVLAACTGDEIPGRDSLDGGTISDGAADSDLAFDSDSSPSPTYRAYTTLQRTLVPQLEAAPPPEGSCVSSENWCQNPALNPLDLDVYREQGFGAFRIGAGDPLQLRADWARRVGVPSQRRSILTLCHLADTHITDEESPNRVCRFDNRSHTGGLKPQDMYSEVVLRDMVNTINYFGQARPFDLVLVVGDIADNAQTNEIQNAIRVLVGGEVDPDSGEDDDPVIGPANDPQDPFTSEGIQGSPIAFVVGNHDVLVQGSIPVTEDARNMAQADWSAGGTRDGRTFEVILGGISPDPERICLVHEELLELLMEASRRSGMNMEAIHRPEGAGYFALDAPNGAPIRIIVLDTAHRYEGYEMSGIVNFSDGVLDWGQVRDFLVPELEAAQQADKLVILASHHHSSNWKDDGIPDRFIPFWEFRELLLGYSNVILHLVGHGHCPRVWKTEREDGSGGYWEVESPSLTEWPMQGRFCEIIDNADGTISVVSVLVDPYGASDSLVDMAREAALIDLQAGWCGSGCGNRPEHTNVEIVIPLSSSVQRRLSEYGGSERLEHATTWVQEEI